MILPSSRHLATIYESQIGQRHTENQGMHYWESRGGSLYDSLTTFEAKVMKECSQEN